jgi:hypothetical protein
MSLLVMPDLIRHPVHLASWIADVETPDLIRGRNDNGMSTVSIFPGFGNRFFNFWRKV